MQTLIRCLSNATQLFSALLIMGGLAFAVPATGQSIAAIAATGATNSPSAVADCTGDLASPDNLSALNFGIPTQDFLDGVEFAAAADFIVPIPCAGEVTLCNVFANGFFFQNGNRQFGVFLEDGVSVRLSIYEDDGDKPGALVFSEEYDGDEADPEGDDNVALEVSDVSALVPGERYWASVQAIMDIGELPHLCLHSLGHMRMPCWCLRPNPCMVT